MIVQAFIDNNHNHDVQLIYIHMRKIVLCFSLISLLLGFTNVFASVKGDDTKPFVGKWDYWEKGNFFELEMDLYDSPLSGVLSITDNEGYSLDYRIIEAVSIQNDEAQVILETSLGKKNASLKYDQTSGNLSFYMDGSDNPIVFRQRDKYGFVIVQRGDKVNVRSTPISGTPLMKADRGQSFRFLGKEKGWFKVQLSAKDIHVGYISPDYVFYLKSNAIPEEAFTKNYSHDLTSIEFEIQGDQIFMDVTTMRPPQPDGSLSMAVSETYAGKIESNAIIFTYWAGLPMVRDINEMTKTKPYIVYYWRDSEMFIIEGENFHK